MRSITAGRPKIVKVFGSQGFLAKIGYTLLGKRSLTSGIVEVR